MRGTWIICLCQLAYVMNIDSCSTQKENIKDIKIVNMTSKVEFHLRNRRNLSDYELTINYSWDVEAQSDAEFDGILYKLTDRHEKVSPLFLRPPPLMLPGGPPIGTSYNACDGLDGTLWVEDEKGSPVECTIPCAKLLPPPCKSSKVCNLLNSGYKPLSRETRSLSMPVKFGRIYDVYVLAYHEWDAGEESSLDGNRDVKYCQEEMVHNQKIDEKLARPFCEKEQHIADMSLSTGPPSDFEKFDMKRDLTINRGTVTFRWKRPFDISPHTVLISFLILITGGVVDESEIMARNMDLQKTNDHYYRVGVRNIEFGKTIAIKVTPFVTKKSGGASCSTECSRYGYHVEQSYTIPDIDACVGDNETSPYCDINADCMDLPSFNETSAICTCHPGYAGNGINTTWEGGTGCIENDLCRNRNLKNQTCDPKALCWSGSKDSNIYCSCPSNYVGDGYTSGSGCTKRSLIIALGFGMPSTAIIVLLMLLAFWRFRIVKNRAVEITLSKFIASKDVVYKNSGPMENEESLITSEGIFGDRWELDKKMIVLEGVCGRGNFGVVYKAKLTVNNNEKIVAVKMMTGCSDMKDDFLSEISLISALGSHDNLIGMIGCCTKDDSSIYLVSEFMKYGDLLHFLWDAREPEKRKKDPIYQLTESSMHQIGRQVASVMKYLVDNKIIHGDLAARNILVGEDLKCKISDFGLANDVYRYGMIKGAREKRVPIKWVSPERMMAGKVPITWRSDVWSFGILLYECITLGSSPHADIPSEELLQKLNGGYRMERPSSCSHYLYNLMLKCWEWTPSKRPTFVELENKLKTPILDKTYMNLADTVQNSDITAYEHDILRRSLKNSPVSTQDKSSTMRNKIATVEYENDLNLPLVTPFAEKIW